MQEVRQDFHHHDDHWRTRQKTRQVSGLQRHQGSAAIPIVLRKDFQKKLSKRFGYWLTAIPGSPEAGT
jgi:hypothetical protein